MAAAAFAPPPLPFASSTWASRCTPRRSRTPLRPTHVCCLIPPQVPSARTAQILAVEERFRALGADSAADLAYVSLSSGSTNLDHSLPNGSRVLDAFASRSIIGTVLSHIAQRLGVPDLLCLDPAYVGTVLEYLSSYLNLSDVERNRVITRRPDIFKYPEPVQKAVEALEETGLQLRDINNVVQRWPGLLLLDARRITRIAAFLRSSRVGFSKLHLRSLLRRAPWILVYDIDADMTPAVLYLRRVLCVEETAHVDQYLRASPLLLGTSPAAMQQVVHFLTDIVGLDSAMLSATLRSFPPLLTCSVDVNLGPAAQFLANDLSLEPEELQKVVRAFPTVLTLDIECDMREVVNYFRRKGVINVGRIVNRLPPILGYDLETNIMPKMEYLENELGLSSFDILRFPGYFSYSLEKCVEPRTKFLQAKGCSLTQPGLNMALGLTDEDFCERIALVPVSQYYAFRKAYLQKKSKDQRHVQLRNENAKQLDSRGAGNEDVCRTTAPASSSGGSNRPTKRRKRRFRATLSRMPWKELK